MTKRLWQISVATSIVVIVGCLLTVSLLRTLNPIVVGVREGSKFQADTAASIVAGLKANTYSSETMTISTDQSQGRSAESPDSPVDIEITGSPLTASDHPDLVSLGVIIELPILLVVHADSTDITSPRDLKGKRIEVGVDGTTIASVAEQILASYGVTATNSTFSHDSDGEALTSFAAKRADAAFVYFNPGLDQFGRLAVSGDYHVLDLPENIALAGQIGTVVPTTVPRGAFSVELSRPDRNIPTVAVPVTVIANKMIRDGAAYAIVQALTAQFSRGTVLAPPGTFPKLDGTLPIHDAALEYALTGSVPWQYEALPGFIADQWTALLVIGSILLLVASIYSVFFPEVYGLWTGILRPRFDRMDREMLQTALANGKELGPRQRARLMKLLDDTGTKS
jgi:ABC-type amino acid transport substrate-binding protein